MDASEARDHIEMVERIIAQSSQRLRAGGEFFLVWGVLGAALDSLITAAVASQIPDIAFYITYPALIVLGIAFSVVRSRYYHQCGDHMSLLQREYLNVLWLTIALATIAMFTMFNLFHSFTAEMALWSFAETIVLFYVGMHGNRRAQIGGIAILASLIVANFVPAYVGWILAAGVLIGYAGFGAAELIARE
jgi:hypothetical protein